MQFPVRPPATEAALPLFRRPKSRRRKPFVHMGGYFGLSGGLCGSFRPELRLVEAIWLRLAGALLLRKGGLQGIGLV